MDKIGDMLNNDFIEKRKGPWGGQIVITAKPHQDHIQKNEDFVWSMCVSYHGLNKFTRLFDYPIPQCDYSISIIAVSASVIYIITIDAKHGYHQVTVYKLHV